MSKSYTIMALMDARLGHAFFVQRNEAAFISHGCFVSVLYTYGIPQFNESIDTVFPLLSINKSKTESYVGSIYHIFHFLRIKHSVINCYLSPRMKMLSAICCCTYRASPGIITYRPLVDHKRSPILREQWKCGRMVLSAICRHT